MTLRSTHKATPRELANLEAPILEQAMQRPSITVVLKNGERYDANHISIVREPRYRPEDQGSQLYGEGCAFSFICSGRMTTKPAEDVERIEYRETGAGWCGDCDGPIHSIVGAGPFANPEYAPT